MRRSWLWLGLALSVAANLFLAGLVLGGGLRGGPGPGRAERPPPWTALEAAERAVARERLTAAAEAGRADRREALRARRQAASTLAADPFDPEASSAAFARSRRHAFAARARMDQALVDTAAALSPEGRARLSAALARDRRGAPRREGPD